MLRFLSLTFAVMDTSIISTPKRPSLQLREELHRARRPHSVEVEGMRKEVSKLSGELHQRDLTITSLSGSLSSVQQQLRGEVERAERQAAQIRVSK